MTRLVTERWTSFAFDVEQETLQVQSEPTPLHPFGQPHDQLFTVVVVTLDEPGVRRTVRMLLTDEAKAVLVRKLTGGIVLSNGALT